MSYVRTTALKVVFACVALACALAHVVFVPQHVTMRGVARVAVPSEVSLNQASALAWAAETGVPICHVPATGGPGKGGGQDGKRLGPCVICAGVLAAVAIDDQSQFEIAPRSQVVLRYVAYEPAAGAHGFVRLFNARGPPRAVG